MYSVFYLNKVSINTKEHAPIFYIKQTREKLLTVCDDRAALTLRCLCLLVSAIDCCIKTLAYRRYPRAKKVVKDSLLRSGPRKSLVKGERFMRETELKPE